MTLGTALDEARQDLSYAVRTLPRDPGLVFGVVCTLALAIGANAAMFGLVGRLLSTAPPGVFQADRVARAELVFTGAGGEKSYAPTMSYPAFRALRALAGAFAATAAVRADTLTLGRGADAEEVAAIAGSGDYFTVLGTRPLLGRFFSASDDELPNGSPVAVLSYAFWRRRFAGDRGVLGRAVVLHDEPYTVVGVAPRGFNGDELAPVDLFVPLTAYLRNEGGGWASDPHRNIVQVIARLRNAVTAAAIQTPATAAVRETWVGDAPGSLPGVEMVSLLPGRSLRQSSQARIGLWLAGVALVVLLIATANVGTLLLLRALRRRREMAVRIALGVSRWRLARQLLLESMLLALAGGGAGLLVAHWFADVVRATLIPGLAPADSFVDGPMLLATAGAVCVAGILGGCAPLAQLGRGDPISELRDAQGSAVGRRSVLRGALVGVQVALCTVLVVGAGLFVRSLQRVQAQDLGFSTSHLLYVTFDLHANLAGPDRDRVYQDAAGRLALVPGVTGVTVAEGVPFGPHHIPPISVPGLAEPPGMNVQLPLLYAATPEYLRMLGVRLLEGRLLTDHDARTAPFVVLVNETMARTVWPGQSAVGRCIRIGFEPGVPPTSPLAPASLPCREVVGVVRDSRARSLIPDGREERLMQYYVPFGQLEGTSFRPDLPTVSALLVETRDPERLIGTVQRAAQSASIVPVIAHARPYQDLLDPQLRSWRLGATLFSAFGVLALGIAAIGLFGVISYLVSQRTREIGVRLALGGRGGDVGRLVVGGAVRMVSAGTAAGLVITLAAAPLVQSMLFQTSAREGAVLVLAAAVLLVVTIAAALIPAWRAMRMSPLVALRAE